MKSLEIVNRYIKGIKKLLRNLKDTQEGTIEDFDKFYNEQELKQLQQIKQELEVLEIIKNKEVDIDWLKYCIGESKDNKEVKSNYNRFLISKRQLTMEELLKLKQWLEENE